MVKQRRKIKLIKPRLQIQLTLIFVGLSLLGLFMQLLLFMATLSKVSLTLPDDGDLLMSEMGATMLYVIGISAMFLLPLTFVVGILTTFRIAGPLYRMEMHLRKIINGERPGRCTIRRGDKLQDFVELLNEAVTVLEARAPENEQDQEEGVREEKAA